MNTQQLKIATELLEDHAERFEYPVFEDGNFLLTAHWFGGGQKTFGHIEDVESWIDEHDPRPKEK